MVSEELKVYREQAIKAAKDLRYGQDVILHIKQAKTINEITRIMASAREKTFNRD